MARMIAAPLPRDPTAAAGRDPLAPQRVTPSGSLADYLEQVAKLVPVEMIAAYLALRGFVPAQGTSGAISPWVEVLSYCVLLGLTPIYLTGISGSLSRPKLQLGLACGSFVVWTYAIGGPYFWSALSAWIGGDVTSPALSGVIVVIWSLVSGIPKLRAPG
jgi:hypothetical protein